MTAAPRGRPRANAFTVDVEEWFHICGVGTLGRPHWDALPSRVVATTRLVLEELARADVRATFFVLGWVAERHPALVAEILAAGHDVGSHGYLHEPGLRPWPRRRSSKTCGAACARSRRPGRPA